MKLWETSVIIGGVGGLGSSVAEILVRSGIGQVILIDNGRIDAPDLNRQFLYTADDIGELKVDVAARRLAAIGTKCDVVPLNIRIENTSEFYAKIAKLNFDIALDCLDNYRSSFAFENVVKDGQFLISGGVANNFGQVITLKKGESTTLSEIYDGLADEKAIGVIPQIVMNVASVMANECIKCITGKPKLLNRFLVIDLENYNFDFIELEGAADG